MQGFSRHVLGKFFLGMLAEHHKKFSCTVTPIWKPSLYAGFSALSTSPLPYMFIWVSKFMWDCTDSQNWIYIPFWTTPFKSWDQCTMKFVHCTVDIVHWTLKIVQWTLNIVLRTLYNWHCTLYNENCTLYNWHCWLYNGHVHCTMDIVHCTLYCDICTLTGIYILLESLYTRSQFW